MTGSTSHVISGGTLTSQAIQLLASLSNPASRERFAHLVLAGESGLPSEPKADRLLIEAKCAREDGGRTELAVSGIRAALDELRSAKDRSTEKQKIEFLPKNSAKRDAALWQLVQRVLPDRGRVREAALNEKLAEEVVDVALVRRAMVDHGLVERDPAKQVYWRVERD